MVEFELLKSKTVRTCMCMCALRNDTSISPSDSGKGTSLRWLSSFYRLASLAAALYCCTGSLFAHDQHTTRQTRERDCSSRHECERHTAGYGRVRRRAHG